MWVARQLSSRQWPVLRGLYFSLVLRSLEAARMREQHLKCLVTELLMWYGGMLAGTSCYWCQGTRDWAAERGIAGGLNATNPSSCRGLMGAANASESP